MPPQLDDKQVRLAAFNWLAEQVAKHGDVLPHRLPLQGFEIGGERVPLVSRAGPASRAHPYQRSWPFERSFTPAPVATEGPYILHAEIWPGVVKERVQAIGKSKLDDHKEEIVALLKNGSRKAFVAKRYGTSKVDLYNWLKKNRIEANPKP